MPLSLPRPIDRSLVGTGALLKGMIWLFTISAIGLAWVVALQQMQQERERAVHEAIAQNVNRSIAFEQYVRRTLEVAALATRYVAERFQRGEAGPEFLGTPARPVMLRGSLARTGTFTGIAIVNANGDVIARSRPDPSPHNVAADEAFRVHVSRDSGALFVIRPIRPRHGDRDLLLLSRRLNNPDGSFGGIVVLCIAPEQFTGFYRDARMGPQDLIALIGLDGITRARRTGDTITTGEDLRGSEAMRRALAEPNGTSRAASTLDGVVRYFSRRRLDGYPLFVVYGVPEAEIMAAPERRIRVLTIVLTLGTLATLGFAVALTLLINRGERRAIEGARERERLAEAQRIARIGDWHVDLTTRQIRTSPGMLELIGRDPQAGPPPLREYRAMLTEDSLRVTDREMTEVMQRGVTREFEITLKLPSGEEAHHHVVVVPLRSKNGEIVGIRGTTQDISGRKRIERLEARIAQLSRIDAMNAMATTLAHELNQPLAAGVNYLAGCRRLLEASPDDEAGLRDGLRAAEQQIHFAGEIIRRVREMVANQPKAPTSFSLAPVVDDAIALIVTTQDGSRPRVTKRLPADARRVSADRVQVQQVLVNLLRNAFEATQAGGEILVSSRGSEPGMIQISVIDTGHGFRQPEAERFSPFAAKDGGLGLGLSLSRTIVEAHGGRIWTEDRDGGGAAVHFTLPVAEAPAESQAEAAAPA